MSGTEAILLCLALGSSQVLGLALALITRLSEGSKFQATFQALLLIYLGVMGGATIVSLAVARGVWLGFGATFSAMVVMAVYDSRQPRRMEI